MTRTAVRTQVSIPPKTKTPGAQMDAFETFVRHAPFAAALVDNGFRLTAVSPDWASHGLSPAWRSATTSAAPWSAPRTSTAWSAAWRSARRSRATGRSR
jgi:hypothetical protein